jgi:hypothetical protein
MCMRQTGNSGQHVLMTGDLTRYDSSRGRVFEFDVCKLRASMRMVQCGVWMRILQCDVLMVAWPQLQVSQPCGGVLSCANPIVRVGAIGMICVHDGVFCVTCCRYRSLAGVCCRVLRLDLLLLAAHQLNALTTVSHLCEEEDVMEVRV